MIPKLVRDGIPDRIRAAGGHPDLGVARPVERAEWLALKLQEEVDEFKAGGSRAEELVDIYEVLLALWEEYRDGDDPTLETAAAIKRDSAGGFNKMYILKDVR